MARLVLEQLSDFGDYSGGKALTGDQLTDSLSDVRLSPDGRHIHVILRKPKECKAGWHLLQTSDLCNSPRARVVSVCVCDNLIIWCEERPPSESSPAFSSTRNKLRYCVCRRDFEVEEGAVSMGGVKISLHNNPKFTVVSSGEYVHLLPDLKVKPPLSISSFFLSWSLRHDSFTISTTCKNAPLKRLSSKESDFKKLLTDCLGYLSTLEPPQIYDFSPTACGGLLLLLSTGWVCLLQKDGMLRQVYKLADNCLWRVFILDALLVEAVFEEACKYYQQRSLSSTQLTVDALKKGGRFQAPISLASILRNYLSTGSGQKGAELSKNGGVGCTAGQDKLMCSLEAELKALVSLEEVKGSLVRGSVKEVEAACDSLVEKEVTRLLSSSELDKEALLYLNSIFNTFPHQGWRAVQAALQLHYNGEGSLSSRAPPDIWKTVLSPVVTPSTQASSLTFTNGRPKHNHSLKGDHIANCKTKPYKLRSPSSPARSSLSPDRDQHQDLEVELLLVSGRPNAILQALRILMAKQQWERVTQVAQKFCKQSPLLNKEIFTTLLCEVAQHRDLDPYLELLTVSSPPAPFADSQSSQLTIGLLKPLLRKVLQRETKPSQRYADILQSPSFPPPAPPRQPRAVTDPSTDSGVETPEQRLSTHTAVPQTRVALPANPV
ncbi:Hermansky-Pudlak syndrome 6 protein-like protein Ruby-eye protein [Larimichthys crocea]|uniref:Hermansky-Pudlak syndrome 6 protein-like protein Ruby-eye protein n=1 Tax=Larimichthys crocea TaxID=215358 RepID=A0A6G0HNG3_LARCR|nr:Hermansky-Pudlak syndrome 6 protein-like protein Ruby-eye protein [Larimichthys crocea]